jgi:hypothetical protein
VKDLIADIQLKLDLLVQDRDDLQSKVEAMQVENEKLKAGIAERDRSIDALKEKNKTQTIAKSLEDSADRTSAKLKINELVREIDKCVALINK